MTCQAVFDEALRLIGEEPGADDIADYTARGPHLLGMACRALASLDRLCREVWGYAAQSLPETYPLTADFPLCDELLPATALHVASGLLFDESATQSDRCFDRFRATVDAILGALPARVEEIAQRY